MRRLLLALALLALWASPAAAQTVCTGFTQEVAGPVTTHPLTFTGVSAGYSLITTTNGNDETHTETVDDDSANGSYTVSAMSPDPGGTNGKYTAAFPDSVADDGTIVTTVTFNASVGAISTRHVLCSTTVGTTLEQIVNDADGGASSTTFASPAVTTTCSAGTLVFMAWTNSARTTTIDVGTDVGAASQNQHGFYQNFASSGLQPTMTITASSAARWTGQVVVLCDPAAPAGNASKRMLRGFGR